MLRNCKGFSLIETLVAFSIWFLLLGTILPQMIQVIQERKSTYLLNTANELLYEELQSFVYEEENKISKAIQKNNESFFILWEEVDNQRLAKACISWTDKLNRGVERCGYAKR